MAEIETIVQPDSVTDNLGWESVTFISIHSPILTISATLLVTTLWSIDFAVVIFVILLARKGD